MRSKEQLLVSLFFLILTVACGLSLESFFEQTQALTDSLSILQAHQEEQR